MLILSQDDILSWRAADELFLLHEVPELSHSYTEPSKDTVKFYLFHFFVVLTVGSHVGLSRTFQA